jgi:uncharacterized membrane protein YdbT with pleckstrin-like domain
MTKIYKSKIGLSFAIPLALSLVLPLVIMVMNRIWVGVIIIGVVALFVVLFVAYLFTNTYYEITDSNKLTIKAGFLINIEIDINSIQSVEPTKSMLAAPALSLDRLKICYNKYSSVIISPKEKDDFIRQLKMINPNIIVK